MVEQC
jgi:hypothetical protein